ncbi:MAG TPA: energy transducer TonB [Gemmatimonadales bacterium]|nr:energy transducer TonB [Gemmatimonadales bacterium]
MRQKVVLSPTDSIVRPRYEPAVLSLTFLETKPTRRKRHSVERGAVSLVIHSLIIALALYATHHVIHADDTVKADTTVVLLTAPKAPEPAPAVLEVPVKGFQSIVVPTVIPANIPPVNLAEHFDPNDYTGKGVEGGHADGAAPLANQLYAEAVVEEKPLLVSAPPLPYPETMRRLGIEGRVLLQAVVDTTGRVEPGSIKIMSSSNSAFDQPTRLWVLKALFRPARLHGEAVRVLISQPVDYHFAVSRSGG